MGKRGICKYCGKETELIDAHIISKGFYKNYKEFTYKALYSDDGTWKQKQNGISDNNILCTNCDNKILGKFEKEGYRVLREEVPKHAKHKSNPKGILYTLTGNDYDYNLLRKFFITILWRASISNEKDFEDINLGPYEDKALEILKGTKEYNNLFRVMIYKIPEDSKLTQVVYMKRNRYYTTIYNIIMYGYEITIFVNYDKLPQYEKSLWDNIIFNEEHLYIGETQDVLKNNFLKILEIYKKWEKKKIYKGAKA